MYICRYFNLQKQVYEIEAMQRLSPVSTAQQQREREISDRNMDDSLARCAYVMYMIT